MLESDSKTPENYFIDETLGSEGTTRVILSDEDKEISFEDHILMHTASEYASLTDPQATIAYAAHKLKSFPLLSERLLDLFEVLDSERFAGQPDELERVLNQAANRYHNLLTDAAGDPDLSTRYAINMLKIHPQIADKLDSIFTSLNTWQSITNYEIGDSVVAGNGYVQSLAAPDAVSRGNLVKIK